MAQRRRDSQEGIFTKLKSDNQLDYVPTPTWAGNQIYLLSMLLAHNLGCAGDRPSSLAHYENLCNVGVYLNHRGGNEHGRLGDLDHRSRRITGRATDAAEHGGAR